CQKYNDSPNSF
nr:immunoglobulin light chain junction region [Macaca mulatta]MOW13913.1 immunoglobulin light chain junction region [Macaca mulatta]